MLVILKSGITKEEKKEKPGYFALKLKGKSSLPSALQYVWASAFSQWSHFLPGFFAEKKTAKIKPKNQRKSRNQIVWL